MRQWHDGQQDDDRDTAPDEDVISALRWHPRARVAFEQLQVAQVGLEGGVEQIAEERHDAGQQIQARC